MTRFDWSQSADPLALQPGNYYVEIIKAEEKPAATSGNLMWNLTLKALDFGCKLGHDRMMLSGGGANITAAKLSALGFTREDKNVECGHLLGKRFYVAVKEKPADGQYQRSLEVDISVKGSKCGYWAEKPADVQVPSVAQAPAADETPF